MSLATPEESTAVQQFAQIQTWLAQDVEEIAVGYAISHIVPKHYGKVKEHKQKMADKIAKEVKERLTCEI